MKPFPFLVLPHDAPAHTIGQGIREVQALVDLDTRVTGPAQQKPGRKGRRS